MLAPNQYADSVTDHILNSNRRQSIQYITLLKINSRKSKDDQIVHLSSLPLRMRKGSALGSAFRREGICGHLLPKESRSCCQAKQERGGPARNMGRAKGGERGNIKKDGNCDCQSSDVNRFIVSTSQLATALLHFATIPSKTTKGPAVNKPSQRA